MILELSDDVLWYDQSMPIWLVKECTNDYCETGFEDATKKQFCPSCGAELKRVAE